MADDFPPGLGGLRPEVFAIEIEDIAPVLDLTQLTFEPLAVLLKAADPEFREVELGAEPEELLVPLGDQGDVLFAALLLLLELRRECRDLSGELGDFAPVAQKAPIAPIAAPARQDAARADDVPLRRNEGAAEAVLLPEGDAAPEAGDEKDVA